MTQLTVHVQEPETSSLYAGSRLKELAQLDWERCKPVKLARNEKILMNNNHWAVLDFLRRQYLKRGSASNHESLTKNLGENISTQAGNRHQRGLTLSSSAKTNGHLAHRPVSRITLHTLMVTSIEKH